KLYMIYRGLLALLHRSAMEALARPGAQARTLSRCRALHAAGQSGFFMGSYDEAQGYLEESLSIAQEIGDMGRAAIVLMELGSVTGGQGNLPTARRYLEQALVLAGTQDNKRLLASANAALGQLCRVERDLDTAQIHCEHALELARGLEDRENTAIGLLNLAMVAIGRGSGARARMMLREALDIAAEIGDKRAGQSGLEVSAGLAALRKEWNQAAHFFGAAESQMVQTGL